MNKSCNEDFWWQKWQHRFKTMVRYRLLILTSLPIAFTLIALIAISLYWSLHYTWQSALVDVSERLGVAQNSITLLQQKQAGYVHAFADSYDFRQKIKQGDLYHETFTEWVQQQKKRYELDFLSFHAVDTLEQQFRYLDLTRQESFFDILSEPELKQLDSSLAMRAQIPILRHREIEPRGLVSRTVIPVRDDQQRIIGFLDGGLLLNNSTRLVDQLRDLIYPTKSNILGQTGTVTLFLDDLRVSTNVPLDSHAQAGRAIGTRVSLEVAAQVLQQGQLWVDKAYVYDAWYISAYQPIRDQYNQVVGMIYTGYLLWPFIQTYLTNIVEMGSMTLILLMVSGLFVYRGSRDLFRPIERIHRVVKLVQLGKNQRIGSLGLDEKHELAQLAKQFDTMLDLLQQRNEQIQHAAQELEEKVHSRTASLHEKTQQLEHHIQLLNQTRNKLVTHEKLAALGELTAGIAHEINNPTAVILGNTELIRFELGEEAERVNEEIEAILLQVDRIRHITRSLLQYSRHGGVQDEVTWQHVNPIIEESMTLVKAGSKKRDVEFITQLQAQCSVEVNRHHLLQILVNLQMNAIHAMQGHGKLTIRSEDWIEAEQILGSVIHVQDEGCGIKPEHLTRIFDPFYTTRREGTGLGLSVSQSLLSRVGGEIRVQSVYGEGSIFSIYLPEKADSHLLITKAS
ncbi:sensor histidine kinase [Vibrio cincinnatiensis]|uniref:sensor histidine kinase n=1 Tax=Vibrio cincinnatiensis TaxID=675 RepID=UPI001EDE83D7|nr:HAMP domain-containing sensor histidine kinase [Vibrio cincinnatiensis]MCG3721343.1 HAMP domain-containing protein [Vibrio cincinnatiensis]MCG3736237.1 HAMP domain-containing protein [Vibrio cincinnatiensis]